MHKCTEILFEQVVSEVHHKIVVTQEVGSDQNAVCKTQRFVLRNERDLGAPLTSVAERGHDFDPGVANDDSDFSDTRRDHGLDSVKQNGFVGNGHQLLGTGVSDGAQSGARTTSQNQSFHVNLKGSIWSGLTVLLFCHLTVVPRRSSTSPDGRGSGRSCEIRQNRLGVGTKNQHIFAVNCFGQYR